MNPPDLRIGFAAVSFEEDCSIAEHAIRAWAAGDVQRVLSVMHPDIIFLVNVDGIQVPWAASSYGREDVEFRITLVLTTFWIERFALKRIVSGPEFSTASVHGIYRHKNTGEVLDVMLRFNFWTANNQLTRIEEFVDGRYLEAYDRFVRHIQMLANSDQDNGVTPFN
ncbi:hypothetical protein APY04_1480 [Hyphomicrobium sulfonivorans]|uniref:SnoaL-like domain-containing protein n=1 Tax=Hyphomicrobium sulfonivorans TaxID=121290 RepID=A0A109BIH3_HYPSL|nr:hypothetical protein APY04_1480 [Hyphomicrobium sulfonivorans]